MPQPETKIVNKIKARLTELRKAGRPLWHFKVHGGPAQLAGVPDLCVVYNGIALFLEVKQPGKKLARLQEHRIDEIRAAGGVACRVESVECVEAVLNDVDARMRSMFPNGGRWAFSEQGRKTLP